MIQNIYGRSIFVSACHLRRYNASDPFDYDWAGSPVTPGVTLPGTWTGFAGTLAALNLPAADAFAVGLIWLMALMAALISLLVAFKFSLEALVKTKRIKENRLAHFRYHWAQYIALASLRALLAAFSMITTLTFYQFSSGGSAGTKALAAVFFVACCPGVGGLAVHVRRIRLRNGQCVVEIGSPDLRVRVDLETHTIHLPGSDGLIT